jgi:hypothetical protein
MQELNEYQKRANAEAVEFHKLLAPIVDQLPDPWSLQPIRLDADGHAYRCHYIQNDDTGQEIMARYNEYDIRGKFEFKAIKWPEYTDEAGRKCSKGPENCYQPGESAPRTRAAAGREPKAIAKQIESKIIPEYQRIYERCEGLAAESQKYHDATKAALDLLTAATGDDRHSTGRRSSGWYLQDYPGSQRIEFHSVGDVSIRLDTQEMLEVIDLLYRRNTGKPRDQAKFYACPECGCTDIEMTAWLKVNADQPTQDEPPRDDGWCPQCGIDGNGELADCRFAEADEPKPFSREGA